MKARFTLEYWLDGNMYVGRLIEIPGVFSQGKTVKELLENIRDAYHLMMEDEAIEVGPEAHRMAVSLRNVGSFSVSYRTMDANFIAKALSW